MPEKGQRIPWRHNIALFRRIASRAQHADSGNRTMVRSLHVIAARRGCLPLVSTARWQRP